MDVVYLDFQKAFDKVPHQRLLLKLKAHGIGNDVIKWIEKWLTHRRQRVIVFLGNHVRKLLSGFKKFFIRKMFLAEENSF